jgi:hypothetical protein
VFYKEVDIYNYSNNSWTLSYLSIARDEIVATTVRDMVFFSGGYDAVNILIRGFNFQYFYALVDIYNSANNTWTTASLSQARARHRATTVGNLAIFAGGLYGAVKFLMRICSMF